MSNEAHRNPPFRAEHIGSLKRTNELLYARSLVFEQKAMDKSELATIEERDVKDIVKIQTELGFHACTDGEYKRHMFWGSFFTNLEGFEDIEDIDASMFRLYVPDVAGFMDEETKTFPAASSICTGKIKHVRSDYVKEFKYLQSVCAEDRKKTAKLTLAAPNWYHLRYKAGKAYPKEVYANDEEYFADIAKAYREELKILYEAGCRNVQFDDPNLAYFCSPEMLEGFKKNGEDSDALLDAYIKLYNDCLSERPQDMHVGIHLCRGNFLHGRHFARGAYDVIAKKLFQELNVDTYYLEYDTERAGGFEPLQFLPAHKNVILGVVSSKKPELEDLGELRKRVEEAGHWIAKGSTTGAKGLERVGVSPQCGFASHEVGNDISRDEMVEKLRLVRKLADNIWPGEL